MAERQAIKKFSGYIVGFYDVEPNGDKTIREFSGKILGFYKKDRDVTTDFYGRIIAFGDISGIFFKDHFNI